MANAKTAENVSFNTLVSINELRRLIPLVGPTVTPVIQSEPGCGKSSLLKMLEEDLGSAEYDFIYVDCPCKDMADLGMNIPRHETKTLDFYVASLFKMDSVIESGPNKGKPKKKVIMLDEAFKVNKLMQVMLTRLMLERTVGDAPLPEGSIVFATSNNASDGVGDAMMAHIANRVMLLQMRKPNAAEWCAWAGEHGISAVTRAWVTMTTKVLNSYLDGGQDENPFIFNPKKQMRSFVSPRSLEKADIVIRERDRLPDHVVNASLAGTLGLPAAEALNAFLMLDKELVHVDEIRKNPEKTPIPTKPAALFMVMFNIVDAIETQDDLTAYMKYITRAKSAEVQAVFLTMLTSTSRTLKLVSRNEMTKEWFVNNYELLSGSV